MSDVRIDVLKLADYFCDTDRNVDATLRIRAVRVGLTRLADVHYGDPKSTIFDPAALQALSIVHKIENAVVSNDKELGGRACRELLQLGRALGWRGFL